MEFPGSLSGDGRVLLDGEDIGEASYEIRVYGPKYLPEARGHIDADAPVIRRIVDARGAILQLEGGQTVKILPGRWRMGHAEIIVSGPTPSFSFG
jgi:hypothetical protein